jgi:hypothetical protein
VDRLRYLQQPVTEVQLGGKAYRATATQEGQVVYFNKRAGMWGLMREWLNGAVIDNDPELIADLIGVQYGFAIKDGRDAIQLERKEETKKRGSASPDNGDALALTFAYPVAPSDHTPQFFRGPMYESAYNPFSRPATDEYTNYNPFSQPYGTQTNHHLAGC